MKLYQMSMRVYHYYRTNVAGNGHLTFEEARLKLSRNIDVALRVPIEEKDKNKTKQLYLYGNLHILTVGDRIVWVKNNKSKHNWFYKDIKRIHELNKAYGIENSKIEWNEVGSMDYVDEYAKGVIQK